MQKNPNRRLEFQLDICNTLEIFANSKSKARINHLRLVDGRFLNFSVNFSSHRYRVSLFIVRVKRLSEIAESCQSAFYGRIQNRNSVKLFDSIFLQRDSNSWMKYAIKTRFVSGSKKTQGEPLNIFGAESSLKAPDYIFIPAKSSIIYLLFNINFDSKCNLFCFDLAGKRIRSFPSSTKFSKLGRVYNLTFNLSGASFDGCLDQKPPFFFFFL